MLLPPLKLHAVRAVSKKPVEIPKFLFRASPTVPIPPLPSAPQPLSIRFGLAGLD